MTTPPGRPHGPFLQPFLVLLALGLLGVLSLYPTMAPLARELLARPDAPGVAPATLQWLLLLNPALLTVVGVVVGTVLAPRLGLPSHLAAWAGRRTAPASRFRTELPLALGLGALAAVLVLLLDLAFRPLLGTVPAATLSALEGMRRRSLLFTLTGILYGGVTEELIVRWGLVSLLAWLAWRLIQRGRGAPDPAVLWGAVIGAAVLFGVGHLGTVAVLVDLTPPVVLRTVVLNALGGLVFGWLFWRRSLEAAMVAHATGHVVFAAAAWAGAWLVRS